MDAGRCFGEGVRTAEVTRHERGCLGVARVFREEDRLAREEKAETGYSDVEPAHEEVFFVVVGSNDATAALGAVEDDSA